jgi:hypothetical protein
VDVLGGSVGVWAGWAGGRVSGLGGCLHALVVLMLRALLQFSRAPVLPPPYSRQHLPCQPLATILSSLQGLVCNYVIARNPPNLPTSERAIPVAIFRWGIGQWLGGACGSGACRVALLQAAASGHGVSEWLISDTLSHASSGRPVPLPQHRAQRGAHLPAQVGGRHWPR